jgi:hypothetical protein
MKEQLRQTIKLRREKGLLLEEWRMHSFYCNLRSILGHAFFSDVHVLSQIWFLAKDGGIIPQF